MRILRRLGSGILFALAILGCILALGGIFGVWSLRVWGDQTALDLAELLTGYVALAEQSIDDLDARLAGAEQTVARVQTGITQLRDGGEGDPAVAAIRQSVSEELLPSLDLLADGAAQLHTSLLRFNQTASRLSQSRFIELPPFTDDLATLEARIGQAGAQAQQLRAALDSFDVGRLQEASAAISAQLGDARATLERARTIVATTQAALADLRDRLSFGMTVAAGALTPLLVLFAAGQVSLAAHAWGWLRARR